VIQPVRLGLATTVVLVSLACGTPSTLPEPRPAARKGILSGTVTYADPSPLPPNAVLRVWVWDTVEPADSSTIAEGKFPISGPGPFPFEIFFSPSLIQVSHPYVVRASISVAGGVWAESAEPVTVLTQGASSVALELPVKRVAPVR
jgi:uncharacterized lipoprotein YbaY